LKIFISWSGERSKQVAIALAGWIQLVIQETDTWLSSDDLPKGARWMQELTKELATSDAGIVCLTPENCDEPWIHFEAGAISKMLTSRLWTYLFKIEPGAVTAPLSQFQATRAEKDDTLRLVRGINGASTKHLSEAQLLKTFNLNWPDLEIQLQAINAPANPPPARPLQDIAIENLELTRKLLQHAEDHPSIARLHIKLHEECKAIERKLLLPLTDTEIAALRAKLVETERKRKTLSEFLQCSFPPDVYDVVFGNFKS
jgi:hypothetical protein